MICGLGSVRTLFAVCADLLNNFRLGEFLVGSIILLVLTLLALQSWKRPISKINIVFGLLISILLGLNFLQFGGVSGYAKFNYYAGLYVIIMIYSHWQLFVAVAFHLTLLLIIILLDYFNHPFRQLILSDIREIGRSTEREPAIAVIGLQDNDRWAW